MLPCLPVYVRYKKLKRESIMYRATINLCLTSRVLFRLSRCIGRNLVSGGDRTLKNYSSVIFVMTASVPNLWGLVRTNWSHHLSVYKGYFWVWKVCCVNYFWLTHFLVKVVSFTSTLTYSSKHWYTTVCFRNVVVNLDCGLPHQPGVRSGRATFTASGSRNIDPSWGKIYVSIVLLK